MLDQLTTRLEEIYPQMVDFRRDLHMHPELSFQEVRTPKKVAEQLERLGLEVRREVGGRGVVGILRGGQPGKTLALRADFDALPIQEENDVAYASQVPGVMHACGHDIHTATLLGVAQVLSEVREQLSGSVVFIHQFAEELTPGGAKSMIEDGCLDGVDRIYGAHVHSPQPTGIVAITRGPAMAATDVFEVKISGKGGHGARPHDSIDPVVTASQLVLALQQIVSRNVNPLHPAVLTVGTIQAGSAFNIIPDTALISGTVRTFDEGVRNDIEKAIDRISNGICAASGASCEVSYRRGYPALVNHQEETETIERLARGLFGDDAVVSKPAEMGGEDFAYYLEHVPGTFFFVGGRNDERGLNFPHHHPRFDVDERSMLVAGRLFLAGVLDFLNGEQPLTRVGSQANAAD